MVDQSTFDDTLETLATYVEDVGDELHEAYVSDIATVTIREQDYSLVGHHCGRADNRYIVAGHPDFRFVTIAFFLSVQNNLAADLEPDIAEAIVDEEYDDKQELLNNAAEKLLDQVPEKQMETFKSYCYQFISGSTYETTFVTNEEESLTLFATSHDIFPYEDSFEISDFYRASQTVVSSGERGSRLIGRTVYLDIDESNPEGTSIEFNFNW